MKYSCVSRAQLKRPAVMSNILGRNGYVYVVQTVGVDGVEVYSPSALIREFPMVRQGAELNPTEDVLARVSNSILVFIGKNGRAKTVIVRRREIIK